MAISKSGSAKSAGQGFPIPEHDHRRCVADGLRAAEVVCADNRARLTARRKAVLAQLLEDHAPRGAYEIMDRLDWGARRPAPAQVYRALAFLLDQGLIHRLASLNAYVSCCAPQRPHGAQFLICRDCGTVAELADRTVERAVIDAAKGAGFRVTAPLIEVVGVCPHCASAS